MRRCYECFSEFDDAFSVCPHCGEVYNNKPDEPIYLVPGTLLANRYIVGHAVGAGGFGIVYKAWDTKLETIVAVKEFFVSRLVTRAEGLKNVIVSSKSKVEYDYRKERFLAEARNMAKFGAHRSIPNVFEFFEENNTAYIVMELLEGRTLSEYLKEHGNRIDVDFALMIANEIGNALKSLHKEKIIHRDVAPDNIYICTGKDIRIKLMDLGAAKLADSTDDVIDIILKPGYSPTEQYDNSKNIGVWTDIYALGATLYYMLTGVKPDESTNRKIKDEVVPPQELNPSISENLGNAIMKAMAVEHHMRFKSVDEFLDAINGERKVIPLAKEKRNRSIKRAMGVLASCLILIVGGMFGFNMYYQKKEAEDLNPAEITIWFSVADDSDEETAMNSIKEDFEETFPDVTITLRAISEDEYEEEITKALAEGSLPTLFESTGLPESILNYATDLTNVIQSEQFEDALFVDDYYEYYTNRKQVPLAIEVPVAYVVTSGYTAITYDDDLFSSLGDFGSDTNISYDSRYESMLSLNFSLDGLSDMSEFMNNEENLSPVLLSSTLIINEVRTTLSNYVKTYVYPDSETIYCSYTYEWSIGNGTDDEIAAAERLLSWMMGNVYQSMLMISECSDGQIPVNPTSFESKIQAKELQPIEDIYTKFVFRKEVD